MPELVKEYLSVDPMDWAQEELQSNRIRERYLVMALTTLGAINLVVIFGALTFYFLLIRS